MRLTVTAVALLALTFPVAADAAVDPGQDYGGGHYGSRNAIAGNAIAVAEVNSDGSAMRVSIEAPVKCGAGTIDGLRVPIAADGSFTFAGTTHDRDLYGERRTTTFTGSGRFDGVQATGSLHQTIKIAKRKPCSGDVVFSLHEDLPADANPPDAPPLAGAQYNGRTSQGWGFVLRTNAAATAVTGAAFNYDRHCRNGSEFFNEFTPAFKIHADHSFSIREDFSIPYSNGVERFTVRGAGSFAENTVFGTVKITSTFRSKKTKRITDRCKTPEIALFGAV